jgi:hypothetical protein
MWKPGDPDRRKNGATDALRDRRHHQEDCWLAREKDRRVSHLRDEHHDRQAKTVTAQQFNLTRSGRTVLR